MPKLSKGAVARLRNLSSSLVEAGLDGEMARLLADHIRHASDDSCNRLRPYALADLWGEDRETLLRLFLHATRAGLLELTWDIMCPLCRGAKDRVESLSALRSQAHCSSCNIQFDANFDQSVEVSFRPSQEIRLLESADYCVGGSCNTPHVMMQRSIPPGEDAHLTIDLGEGTYRIRGPQVVGSALLEVSSSHPATQVAEIACSRTDISPQRVELAPRETRLHVRNSEPEELLVLLERMRWPEGAVTTAQVTSMRDFRDLFFSEVLAPEEQFQIRSLTFMFTDLRSSTALYRERGDAPAYVLVRDHFEVISESVARHHGAVVKTIGDAVMVVFTHLADALDAGLYIHRAFSAQGVQSQGVVVKIGVHEGPCIAVNLNGQLDYFGTNVNTAVRLGSQGQGGDVLVDAGTLEDPTISEILARPGVHVEHLTVELRGFEEAFDVCRITEGGPGEGEA